MAPGGSSTFPRPGTSQPGEEGSLAGRPDVARRVSLFTAPHQSFTLSVAVQQTPCKAVTTRFLERLPVNQLRFKVYMHTGGPGLSPASCLENSSRSLKPGCNTVAEISSDGLRRCSGTAPAPTSQAAVGVCGGQSIGLAPGRKLLLKVLHEARGGEEKPLMQPADGGKAPMTAGPSLWTKKGPFCGPSRGNMSAERRHTPGGEKLRFGAKNAVKQGSGASTSSSLFKEVKYFPPLQMLLGDPH